MFTIMQGHVQQRGILPKGLALLHGRFLLLSLSIIHALLTQLLANLHFTDILYTLVRRIKANIKQKGTETGLPGNTLLHL